MTQNNLTSYHDAAMAALSACTDQNALKAWHQNHLSRSGELSAQKKNIGKLPAEDRKAFGTEVNRIATALESAFYARQEAVKLAALRADMAKETIDVTLSTRKKLTGNLHPLTKSLSDIVRILGAMGFSVFESPLVELDEVNFQQLNIPPHHPARDMQDTFFISDDVVMRTHTSPGQIHAMHAYHPDPIRVILPGLTFRHEDVTPRSEMQFHQIEGLMIGEDVRFSDLKGILLRFVRQFFGEDQSIKMRGSYFPFTEPSVEVDITCTLCHGKGCRVCKQTGWVELLGAGLVHPNVLRYGGYDPERVTGIAFGIGLERMTMLRYQIHDIRYFFQNDLRFLSQF